MWRLFIKKVIRMIIWKNFKDYRIQMGHIMIYAGEKHTIEIII